MEVISLQSFLENRKINYKEKKVILKVDISKEIFLKNIVLLYQELLYPLVMHGVKVKIKEDPFTYSNLSISPLLLHTNKEAIRMQLYLEAWYRLLKMPLEKMERKDAFPIETLNKEQKRAVRKLKGAVLLLAPAGSGKTKTLVNRVYALLNKGVDPSCILVLVYNKKAEEEITMRLQNTKGVEVRTFHSFGHELLKKYTDYEFYTEDPKELSLVLLERVLSRFYPIVYKQEKDPFKSFYEKLSFIKNNLLSKEDMVFEVDHERIDFYPIFKSYMEELKEEKLYDFDDMLYLSVCLLLKNASLREKIQKQYMYLLVDEFQDLNPLQLQLLELLALPLNHLFVVGDDDQMIYGFRGASVKPILSFQKTYSGAKVLKLVTNYRSSKRLVYHARMFIEHNLVRTNKEIKSFSQELGKIEIKIGKDWIEEASEIVRLIEEVPTNESLAILYRYQEYGSFLKLFLGFQGYYPLENFSSFDKLFKVLSFFLESFDIKRAQDLVALFQLPLKPGISSFDAFFKTYRDFPFEKVYTLLSKEKISFRRLCLLLKVKPSFFFEEPYLMESFVSYFGGVKALYELSKHKQLKTFDNVLLETIHKTKGNEFDHVAYFHMAPPKEIEFLEEERRISYVALTRAKKSLLITTDLDSYHKYVKNYFEGEKYQEEKKESLLLQKQILTQEIDFKEKKRTLLLKDQQTIKRSFLYEVNEEKEAYFRRQNQTVEALTEQVEKAKEELFELEEECSIRDLKEQLKYDILKGGKGSAPNEKR